MSAMELSRRTELLNDLVRRRQPMETTLSLLRDFLWDCEPLVTVSAHDVVSVLSDYLNDRISAQAVENWAEALESRDDVGFEAESVFATVTVLANPLLEGLLDRRHAERLVNELA